MFGVAPTPSSSVSIDIEANVQKEKEVHIQQETIATHFGVYVGNGTITFKTLDRICDKNLSYGRTLRIKYLPFLRFKVQGVVVDFVSRGDEANVIAGICWVRIILRI